MRFRATVALALATLAALSASVEAAEFKSFVLSGVTRRNGQIDGVKMPFVLGPDRRTITLPAPSMFICENRRGAARYVSFTYDIIKGSVSNRYLCETRLSYGDLTITTQTKAQRSGNVWRMIAVKTEVASDRSLGVTTYKQDISVEVTDAGCRIVSFDVGETKPFDGDLRWGADHASCTLAE